MFCQKCGVGEQKPNSYCRKCGELLADQSANFLLNGIFGGGPERQINTNIIISLVTAVVSGALVSFLIGYYQNHSPTPTIIYPVYVFLTVIAFWQIMNFIIGCQIKSRFDWRKGDVGEVSEKTKNNLAKTTRELLPEADTREFIKSSITENTTKKLTAVEKNK